jgi:hypothetical protein
VNMQTFLTPRQLTDLTDAKHARKQIHWLADHGFKYEISTGGRPKVLLQEVENRLLSRKNTSIKQRPAPRLDILDNMRAK